MRTRPSCFWASARSDLPSVLMADMPAPAVLLRKFDNKVVAQLPELKFRLTRPSRRSSKVFDTSAILTSSITCWGAVMLSILITRACGDALLSVAAPPCAASPESSFLRASERDVS